MNVNLRDKSICVIDNGLFLSFATRLSREDGFGRVYYWNVDRRRGRASFNEAVVGRGYDGITVVGVKPSDPKEPYIDPWKILRDVDIVAFPDCLDGDWQEDLRRQGKKVFGAGRGTDLEIYRYYAKRVLKAVGLEVGPYVVIRGLTKLRDYLKINGGRVIKISYLRGLMETRKHDKYWLSKTFLDYLEYKLGPLADDQEFIVETQIETKLEIGGDALFVDRFPDVAINGLEIKDQGYLGIVQDYAELPEEIRMVNDALEPVLRKYGYAGFFSHEDRVGKDGRVYPIDLTCRQGSPSGEAQLVTWTNMPLLVWSAAHGQHLTPEFSERYVAQAMIFNKGDESEWCGVGIPADIRDDVFLYYGMRKGVEDYVVPQLNPFDEVGSVIAKGDSAEEAIALCKKRAEKIEGNVSVNTGSLDEALEEFSLMEKKGMSTEPASA